MSRGVWARLGGEGLLNENVTYDVEAAEHGDGEAYSVDLTFDLDGLSLTIDFDPEVAEEFIVAFRDEIVRAKQKELEWETDTDPESGVTDDEEREP